MPPHNATRVCVALAAVLLGPALPGPGFRAAAKDPADVKPIYKAEQPVTIDGRHDESCWQAAQPLQVDQPLGDKPLSGAPLPMQVKYAWDEHYFYIAYEVHDTDLVTVGTGRKVGPPDNQRPTSLEYAPEKNLDLAEFFVSFGSVRFFWEVHHTAANHLNNHWCAVPDRDDPILRSPQALGAVLILRNEYIDDEEDARVASAVTLLKRPDGSRSTVGDSRDVDVGYRGEIRLPWRGLGAPKHRRGEHGWKMAGQELRLLAAALNGNDGEARYFSNAADLPQQMFHLSAALWPRFVLIDKPRSD